MPAKPLHLAWFMNFTPGEWDHPLATGGSPWNGEFYVDMAKAMDGFLISTPFQRTSRRFITEVTEGLVPALQRRGLARTAYTGTTLREVLREF